MQVIDLALNTAGRWKWEAGVKYILNLPLYYVQRIGQVLVLDFQQDW